MIRFAAFVVLIVVVAFSGGCSKGSQSLLYCLAVDHSPNLKCT